MDLFQNCDAVFAPNVPEVYRQTWIKQGGIVVKQNWASRWVFTMSSGDQNFVKQMYDGTCRIVVAQYILDAVKAKKRLPVDTYAIGITASGDVVPAICLYRTAYAARVRDIAGERLFKLGVEDPSVNSPWRQSFCQCSPFEMASRKSVLTRTLPQTFVDFCSDLWYGSVDSPAPLTFDTGYVRSSSLATTVIVNDDDGYLTDPPSAIFDDADGYITDPSSVVIDDNDSYTTDPWSDDPGYRPDVFKATNCGRKSHKRRRVK